MTAKHRRNLGENIATSTRVRDQPALTTASGKSWIVFGGLLTLVSLATLVPLLTLAPVGAAGVGIVLVVFLYGGMLVARGIGPGSPRLSTLAALMSAIAVVALVTVGIVAATEWRLLG
jgi:hypothetical protein